MSDLRYTLVADGPTDDALIPVLNWLLAKHLPDCAILAQFADWQRLPRKLAGLRERLAQSLELYPCDLLFVHRDAEKEPPDNRRHEIAGAVAELISPPKCVCVVPVRMTEAWFLFDEAAIRRAAGNPNGIGRLDLPPLRKVEAEADPKETLRARLKEASGLSGRRLLNFQAKPRRVATFIDDFSPLRILSAFQKLETDVRAIAASLSGTQDNPPDF